MRLQQCLENLYISFEKIQFFHFFLTLDFRPQWCHTWDRKIFPIPQVSSTTDTFYLYQNNNFDTLYNFAVLKISFALENFTHVCQILFLSWSTNLGWILFQWLISEHFLLAVKVVDSFSGQQAIVGAIWLVLSPKQEVPPCLTEKRNLIGSHRLAHSHPRFLDTVFSWFLRGVLCADCYRVTQELFRLRCICANKSPIWVLCW